MFTTTKYSSSFHYRRKRSLGQGNIFTPVCHSVHRAGAIPACIAGGIPACLAVGGAIPACLAPGRVPGPGGCLVQGGLLQGGAWSGGSAPGGCLVKTPRTATAAGGTHPTGMHSFLRCIVLHTSSPFTICVKEFVPQTFSASTSTSLQHNDKM